MTTSDAVGTAVALVMYGTLGVLVWVKGWRWALDTLLACLGALADSLRVVAHRLEHGAPARRRAAPPAGRCACSWRHQWENRAVPITSVVTGEVIDHRCPLCWLPRTAFVEVPADQLPSLPPPGFRGHRWGGTVPPPRGWTGGVADDPQGPGFTGGPRMSTGDDPPPRSTGREC